MTINIQLFAAARVLAGSPAVSVHLDAGASVAELRSALAVAVPNFTVLLSGCAIAVNQEFAGNEVRLKEGDEVAVIPPVSGG